MFDPKSQSYMALHELQKFRVPLTNSYAQMALHLATRADEAVSKFEYFREQFDRSQFPFEDLIKEIGLNKAGPDYLNKACQWKNGFEDLVKALSERDTLCHLVEEALKLACENQDPR